MVVPETYADVTPAPLYLHLASGGGDHNGFLEGWRPYLDDLNGLMAIVNTSRYPNADVLAGLIDQVAAGHCVDLNHVHVMGTSSSFSYAEQLAGEYPNKVASFIAALGAGSITSEPTAPVPLLTFTGDSDRTGVQNLVERWVDANGCDPEPVSEDLGSGVRRNTFQNCEADIVFYDIEGMGHVWPVHEAEGPGAAFVAEYEEVDYLEEAYQFFADHPQQ